MAGGCCFAGFRDLFLGRPRRRGSPDAAAAARALRSLPVSGQPLDACKLREALHGWGARVNLECTPPFLVDWYNEARRETAAGQNLIDAPGSAVAFALYSVPGYLRSVVVEHYVRQGRVGTVSKGLVDPATNELLEELRGLLPAHLDALVVNTDEGPPYYHVQTVGAVTSVDQHLEAPDVGDDDWWTDLSDQLEETRDPRMWGSEAAARRKVFGVNVHPIYGGWYAYRALVILRGTAAPGAVLPLTPLAPLEFVSTADKRRILEEYNLRHELCAWRDLSADHTPEFRYTPDEYLFFMETSPAKRRRFLELQAQVVAAGG